MGRVCLYILWACGLVFLSFERAESAELTCVNGGNPNDRRFIEAFERSTDPATLAFKQALARNAILGAQNNDLAKRSCLSPRCTATRVPSLWTGVPIPTGVNAQLNADCLDIALRRQDDTIGSVCMDGRAVSRAGTGTNAPCLDQRLAGFIQYLFNLAVDCMTEPNDPVDPLLFFQKINNETGFSFWLHYRGGSGIGQFTDVAVADLYGRGIGALEELAVSNKASCTPFTEIVRQDLNRPRVAWGPNQTLVPSRFLPSANVCAWNSMGEGIARGLIYSLLKFRSDKRILSAVSQRFIQQPHRVQNLLALVSYGPEGENLARNLAQRSATAEQIQGSSKYVRSTMASYQNYVARELGSRGLASQNPVSLCFEPPLMRPYAFKEVAEAPEEQRGRPAIRPGASPVRQPQHRGRPGR